MSRAQGKRTPRWVGLDELLGKEPPAATPPDGSGGVTRDDGPRGGQDTPQTHGVRHEEGQGEGYDGIPGGLNHLANPPVKHQPVPVPEREWPYRRALLAHGVPPDGRHHDRDPRLTGGQHGRKDPEKLPPRQSPVPVYITQGEDDARPMQWAGASHLTVPAIGQEPVLVAARDLARRGVRLLNEGTGGASRVTASGKGSVTNPGAFTAIAVTGSNIPAGVYQVTATVFLSGTVTAADASNMFIGGSNIPSVQIVYPGVANSPVTITAVVNVTGAGTDTLRVINTASASGAAAVYNASIQVTPLTFGAGIRVGRLSGLAWDAANSVITGGALLPNAMTSYQEIKTQDALYAVSLDSNTPLLSVLLETELKDYG